MPVFIAAPILFMFEGHENIRAFSILSYDCVLIVH